MKKSTPNNVQVPKLIFIKLPIFTIHEEKIDWKVHLKNSDQLIDMNHNHVKSITKSCLEKSQKIMCFENFTISNFNTHNMFIDK